MEGSQRLLGGIETSMGKGRPQGDVCVPSPCGALGGHRGRVWGRVHNGLRKGLEPEGQAEDLGCKEASQGRRGGGLLGAGLVLRRWGAWLRDRGASPCGDGGLAQR